MTKAGRIIVTLISIVILCSIFMAAFATTNGNTDGMTTSSTTNPFEYAKAPEGLYVFLYYGTSPYTSIDIDVTDCVVSRLYVYDSVTDSVTEISEQSVVGYTYTKTALYYVTTEQKIYKTDYSGANHELLYHCLQGTIRNLKSYLDTLYFIEDQNCLMHLDVASKTAQELWVQADLYWAIMLNTSQIIAATTDEDNYLYNVLTNTTTSISSIEATNLITATVKGTPLNNARSTTSTNIFNPTLTQENDISFPLPEYDVENFNSYDTFDTPKSWFHKDGLEQSKNKSNCDEYAEAKRCMGFARYVHDRYIHTENDEITDWTWQHMPCVINYEAPVGNITDNPVANADPTKLKLFNGDKRLIEDFFRDLNTGAYVRYGQYKDNDRADGMHSVVYIAQDDLGIWVYECNQRYDKPDANNDYCCGVFIQYYTYEDLVKYEFITSYVNHNFAEVLDDAKNGYHKVGCTRCDGYVLHPCGNAYVNANYHECVCLDEKCGHTKLQQHDDITVISYVDADRHRARFNCCGGVTYVTSHNDVETEIESIEKHRVTLCCCDDIGYLRNHTGNTSYTDYSKTQHRTHYSCCSGYVMQTHSFELKNGKLVCACGRVKNQDISINSARKNELS